MSTTTATLDHAATTSVETAPRKGFFEWFMRARERAGEARVRATFDRMSDHQLADIGFDPEQISHIRTHGKIPASYWA